MQAKLFASLKERVVLFLHGPEIVAELKQQIRTDSLTGLYNHFCFYEVIEKEVARIERYNKHPLSLAILDIDYFKKINDTYGHAAGDYVLSEIGRLLKESKVLRAPDEAFRYGGEEFAVILPATDAWQGYVVAERIREAIERHLFLFEGNPIPITVSAGVAEYWIGATADLLFQKADELLYLAKNKGRNNVQKTELPNDFAVIDFPGEIHIAEKVMVN